MSDISLGVLAALLIVLIVLSAFFSGSETGMMALVVLIFAEVTPKTLAALHPERVAFPASYVLQPLLWLLYPFVWLINAISNGLLRLLRVPAESIDAQPLSREELRTVVNEAGAMIPRRHKQMLVSILEEIVGNFTSVPGDQGDDLRAQADGSYLVDAGANIRDLNRSMGWRLPSGGPKTLNGLILEHLGAIPETGARLVIAGYPLEVVATQENTVETVHIAPPEGELREDYP